MSPRLANPRGEALVVNPGSQEQPYRQIASELRRAIRSGEFAPGKRLPASTELAVRYGVARQTVQRALDILRVEGLITTQRGRGTFVRAEPARLLRRSRSWYNPVPDYQQHPPLTLRQDITFAQREPAPADIAAILDIDVGAEVVVLRRILYDGDQPVETGASWLRVTDVEGREPDTVPELSSTALHLAVETLTRRRYTYARDVVLARGASEDEARRLRIRPDTHVLTVRRIAYDADRMPFEVSYSAWPEDRVQWIDEYEIPRNETTAAGLAGDAATSESGPMENRSETSWG